MKAFLWIAGLISFVVVPKLFTISTLAESCCILAMTALGMCVIGFVALIACQCFLPQKVKPIEESDEAQRSRRWIWRSAQIAAVTVVAIPAFWMAHCLAPERTQFETVAQNQCEHVVQKDEFGEDRDGTSCGGAIDKEVVIR